MKLENIPKKYRPSVKKVMEGKLSPRKAIKVKCYECVGFEDAKARIRECNIKTCPLNFYRPFQEKCDEN